MVIVRVQYRGYDHHLRPLMDPGFTIWNPEADGLRSHVLETERPVATWMTSFRAMYP